jgi:hypothetical protein
VIAAVAEVNHVVHIPDTRILTADLALPAKAVIDLKCAPLPIPRISSDAKVFGILWLHNRLISL